ncbi:META domain-containing protein [Nocardioides sp. CFH 31398]|uniref:META domain-containing protein n=1 Tax=Nocardioides sp. CFH 31398 TaxID=2919579 RepID=UPI001F06CBD9|nr:META domain-containing protein [Nocardioides sp. CFH 31398]MCH1866770.1 META domain-containing protein [Nocardioides sp. CFH 31398]
MACRHSVPLLTRLDDVAGVDDMGRGVVLVDGSGEPVARLHRVPPTPAEGPPLEGRWSVEALVGSDGRGLLSERAARPAVRFTPGPWPGEGVVDGRTYCNVVEGSYRQDGERLRITSRIPGPVSLCVDVALTDRLDRVRHVTSSRGGDRLTLHARSWMIIAVLDRAPDRLPD